ELVFEGKPTYYSFDVDDCHFAILDAYMPDDWSSLSPEQMAWLEDDLENTGKSHTFVFLHPPLYPVCVPGFSLDTDPEVRDQLAALLVQHEVDAVFVGHEHLYSTLRYQGLAQIITGGAGAETHPPLLEEYLPYNLDELSRYKALSTHHYVVVQVKGEEVSIVAYDLQGEVIDQFRLGRGDVVVTGLIQDPTGTVGEVYQIDAVVHNAGRMTGGGWVTVEVKDAGGAAVWSNQEYVENLAPCDTTTVSFFWHPAAAGLFTVQADEQVCPVEILAAHELVVTGIQQPPDIQVCEDLVVSIDVHNAGDLPAEGTVIAGILDLEDNKLAGPFFIDTGVLAPCDTITLPVEMGHVDESWAGTILVWAGFDPEGSDAFICPMTVLLPFTPEITGIQHPQVVPPDEEFTISVDVHNAGDKPGECEVVTIWIEDELGAMVWEPETAGTGVLAPCDTAKVPFGPIHIDEAWDGETITVFAQACDGVPETCDIVVSGAPCLMVEGIQQPDQIAVCDELSVAVDVHNWGGKPGECDLITLWIEDAMGSPLVGPITVPTGIIDPCETVKIPFGPWHVDESWMPGVTVWASSCCGDPVHCPIAVTLLPGPPIAPEGSWWDYEVTYEASPQEAWTFTATMIEHNVLPPAAGNCVTGVPQVNSYHVTTNTNSDCDCSNVPCTTSSVPSRRSPVAQLIVHGPIETYGSMTDLTSVWLEAPVCVVDPAMGLMVAEQKWHTYTAVSGTVGFPYAVGDEWIYTEDADTYSEAFGACVEPLIKTWTQTVEALGVSVTVPAGTFTDCVYMKVRRDDGCCKEIWWSPTVMTAVKQIDPCAYIDVETQELSAYNVTP
ncbi:MAG: metallophosphoesterase, partial [Dehalococcoidia bacterium]|nr:metallophosphoesterase [Dehalococcoidia bacterium]